MAQGTYRGYYIASPWYVLCKNNLLQANHGKFDRVMQVIMSKGFLHLRLCSCRKVNYRGIMA